MGNAIEKNEADIDLIADKAREREELLKLVCEVRAKNGMTPSRMNRVLERLDKTNMMPKWN
jgi:hypothetical protein